MPDVVLAYRTVCTKYSNITRYPYVSSPYNTLYWCRNCRFLYGEKQKDAYATLTTSDFKHLKPGPATWSVQDGGWVFGNLKLPIPCIKSGINGQPGQNLRKKSSTYPLTRYAVIFASN